MTTDQSNVITQYFADIRAELQSISARLDALADVRRLEAREAGEVYARLEALEVSRRDQVECSKSNRSIAMGAAVTAVGALLVVIVRLALSHPDVVK